MSNIIVATYGIIKLKIFKNKSDAVTNSDKMFCDYIIFLILYKLVPILL